MEPIAWFMKALKNYVGFEGRARRKEFWYFALVSFVASIVLAIVDAAIGTGGAIAGQGVLGGLWSLVLLLPSLAVGARRLHDTGKTGWWLLLYLTGIGIIVLIVFWVMEGDKESNQYGSDPMLEPVPTM